MDVAQNIDLVGLTCRNNQISILNLTQNSKLIYLWVENNQLQGLDMRNGNNINVTYFNSQNNPSLTCIFVDDSNYSMNNPDWIIDPNSTFVETQQECDDLAGIEDLLLQKIKIYPNPTKEFLYIKNVNSVDKVEMYNILGEKILQINNFIESGKINLRNLSSGIYFLRISKNQNISVTKKIIKL